MSCFLETCAVYVKYTVIRVTKIMHICAKTVYLNGSKLWLHFNEIHNI